MEEERGLLFVLEEPVIRLDNGEQAMAIFVVCASSRHSFDHSHLLTVWFQADDARHKTKANMSYEQLSQSYENGQPSRMHRASTRSIPDPTTFKRPFDILLVDDKELRDFANRRDVKLKCEELIRGLTGASTMGTPPIADNPDLFASSVSVGMWILFVSQILNDLLLVSLGLLSRRCWTADHTGRLSCLKEGSPRKRTTRYSVWTHITRASSRRGPVCRYAANTVC